MLSIVKKHSPLHACNAVQDARSARDIYNEVRPEIVILDVALRYGDGIELMKEFAQSRLNTAHIFVSEICEISLVNRAFEAGAKAFVSKQDESIELSKAFNEVAFGKTYIGLLIEDSLRVHVRLSAPDPVLKLIGNLSHREMHVFRRMAQGEGATTIAREVGISVKTVETHQARIKEKLHLGSVERLRYIAKTWLKASRGEE